MIIGSYPCCGGPFEHALPEKTPAYFKQLCPHCGAVVWHRLSKADPESWTEADFLASHKIDEASREIMPIEPPPETSETAEERS